MIYPNQINSMFFRQMITSGWYQEREIIHNLPDHILNLPQEVIYFLKQIWYLNIVDDFFNVDCYQQITYSNTIYSIGDATSTLYDYSNCDDEYTALYQSFIGKRIFRQFGDKNSRELLIDEYGYIYILPDSGELYFMGAKYYEGLFNLIYNEGKHFRVEGGGVLVDEKEGINSNLNLFM